ncbi:MAG: right-handed parallel beta-helix repeat-containing protein [Planctomycetales bacterium]
MSRPSLFAANAVVACVFLLHGLPRACAAEADSPAAPPVVRAEIRVGIDEGDLRGNDHRALQAAIDYVANLGGGTVHVGPGRYEMRNALRLRDGVNVVGVPGKTVLVACDGFESALTLDGDCNERQITVADPARFRVGDGVSVQDSRTEGGFGVTTATLLAQTGPDTFAISTPLYFDYLVSNQATARLVFPVVGGWQAKDVVVEGLVIDGNRERAQPLNGCRGGGIYLFECDRVTIRNCHVKGYNGDGISFQVSQHVIVEDCVVEEHAGLGIHPGSGSQHPIVRRNRATGNGRDGCFVCWRVKHGLFEDNVFEGNRRYGICIGHKDTDNLFRNNTVVKNAEAGLFFRNESEAMGAHRNVFEKNRILDNGDPTTSSRPAAVVIKGTHHDLVFRDNEIGNTEPGGQSKIGILTNAASRNLTAEEGQFRNVEKTIETRK